MEDVGRLPRLLWGWRWIPFAMVVSGIPLARMERFAQPYPPPWRDRITADALLAVVRALVIGDWASQCRTPDTRPLR
jgi:hypothetical protein